MVIHKDTLVSINVRCNLTEVVMGTEKLEWKNKIPQNGFLVCSLLPQLWLSIITKFITSFNII